MKDLMKHLDILISRYPVLEESRQDIEKAYLVLEECYREKKKVLIAGNGGSAADAEHIVGELMKGFKLPRNCWYILHGSGLYKKQIRYCRNFSKPLLYF